MKPLLTNKDYENAARLLGCEVAAIKSVAEVESYGKGFLQNGEPVILFERHVFSRLTKGIYDKSHPGISNPNPGGYGPESIQHARLQEAASLNKEAALMSVSWGKFQLMGFNYRDCGFAALQLFINAMYQSEQTQLLAFIGFIKANKLDDELRNKNWESFAMRYNGPNYKKNKYDTKLADAYKKYSA